MLFVLMLLNSGPVVWITGWLNRLAGSDSSALAFAIAFGVISLPVGLLSWRPGRVARRSYVAPSARCGQPAIRIS